MKFLKRDPEKFDLFELYAALAPKLGYRIGEPGSESAFSRHVEEATRQVICNAALHFGKQTEVMFSYVVGALNTATLVKNEDAACLWKRGDIQPPDYRIVLPRRREILVEVKNATDHRSLKMRADYVGKLRAYARVCRRELFIAVYWTEIGIWTLSSIEDLIRHRDLAGREAIDLESAMMLNQMTILGDRMIGTEAPLSFWVRFSDSQLLSRNNNESEYRQTIREIRISSNGRVLLDAQELRIAFYLLRYGDWRIRENATVTGDRMERIEWIAEPFVPEAEQNALRQRFHMIGTLSSMASRSYLESARGPVEGESDRPPQLKTLSPAIDPESLSVVIPRNYRGKNLPIWRFSVQPNREPAGAPQ